MRPTLLPLLASLHLVSAIQPPILSLYRLQQSFETEAVAVNKYAPHHQAHNFSIPVDHFHNSFAYEPHSDASYANRYFIDDTHYSPGGPVILYLGGETAAENRLPLFHGGIIQKIANATGGLQVILEHRYYGYRGAGEGSWPTPDLSTHNMRFLTTEQALADTAFFAQNIVFPGHEDVNLTAKAVPWIVYGGSYAGAQAAFQRKLYPDVFWGAISSSGVTEAIYEYPEYWQMIQEHAPQKCIRTTEAITEAFDVILMNKTERIPELKELFGLRNLTSNKDFASLLLFSGIGGWQARNWDPVISGTTFDNYCEEVTSNELLYPGTLSQAGKVNDLLAMNGALTPDHMTVNLTLATLNLIGFVNRTEIAPCLHRKGSTADSCFASPSASFWAKDDLEASYRSWPYQYCTQWGYLQTGSGQVTDRKPILSRTLDLEFESRVCKYAFNITTPPDTDAINKYGGFNISYPRLAHIAGSADPWTPATPWKEELKQWEWRKNDTSEPFLLIEGAVHHWDSNGLVEGEEREGRRVPEAVRRVQEYEVEFVSEWVEEARESGKFSGMMGVIDEAEVELEGQDQKQIVLNRLMGDW